MPETDLFGRWVGRLKWQSVPFGNRIAIFILLAFMAGAAAAALWVGSEFAWRTYLERAEAAGGDIHMAYVSRLIGMPLETVAPGIKVAEVATAEGDSSDPLPRFPPSAYYAVFSLKAGADLFGGPLIPVLVVSHQINHRIAEISSDSAGGLTGQFGQVSRALARKCSDAILYAKLGRARWLRIDGAGVWSCAAQPVDHRIAATMFGIVSILLITGIAATQGGLVQSLAEQIKKKAATGSLDPLPRAGPRELHRIAEAVDELASSERRKVQDRILLMSGISHDIGTPATRLKLRAHLLEDGPAKDQIVGDIDKILCMVQEVLDYSRLQIDLEPFATISMASLIESVVDDYADMGKPVSYAGVAEKSISAVASVFLASPREHRLATEPRRNVIARCRPRALSRALSNIIDNALRFGKSAVVSLDYDAESLAIEVEDNGPGLGGVDPQELIQPFHRGSAVSEGNGLGLTIAYSILEAHGGTLTLIDTGSGLRVRMELPRGV